LYAGATTGLYPATLFDGVPLFREGLEPSKEERATYLEQIWTPYHRTCSRNWRDSKPNSAMRCSMRTRSAR
jgi:N-formylglutamate amidohydrolase